MGAQGLNLSAVNQAVTLGINLANEVVPMITGIIKDLKSKANADGTMEYTVVLSTGQANLTQAAANFQSSLQEISDQLTEEQTTNATTIASAVHNPRNPTT